MRKCERAREVSFYLDVKNEESSVVRKECSVIYRYICCCSFQRYRPISCTQYSYSFGFGTKKSVAEVERIHKKNQILNRIQKRKNAVVHFFEKKAMTYFSTKETRTYIYICIYIHEFL